MCMHGAQRAPLNGFPDHGYHRRLLDIGSTRCRLGPSRPWSESSCTTQTNQCPARIVFDSQSVFVKPVVDVDTDKASRDSASMISKINIMASAGCFESEHTSLLRLIFQRRFPVIKGQGSNSNLSASFSLFGSSLVCERSTNSRFDDSGHFVPPGSPQAFT